MTVVIVARGLCLCWCTHRKLKGRRYRTDYSERLNPLPMFYAETAHVGDSAQRLADGEALVPTPACSQ